MRASGVGFRITDPVVMVSFAVHLISLLPYIADNKPDATHLHRSVAPSVSLSHCLSFSECLSLTLRPSPSIFLRISSDCLYLSLWPSASIFLCISSPDPRIRSPIPSICKPACLSVCLSVCLPVLVSFLPSVYPCLPPPSKRPWLFAQPDRLTSPLGFDWIPGRQRRQTMRHSPVPGRMKKPPPGSAFVRLCKRSVYERRGASCKHSSPQQRQLSTRKKRRLQTTIECRSNIHDCPLWHYIESPVRMCPEMLLLVHVTNDVE